MEERCGTSPVTSNCQAAGELPPNPYFACLRKISYARFGRSSLAAIRYQFANQLVSKDHRQHFGDSLCSIAICGEVRDENQRSLIFGFDAAVSRDTRASVFYERAGQPDCPGR